MSNNIPDAFVFMKVGAHAGESLEQIMERKNQEHKQTGMIFWGYGGSACHPLHQVQPFARMHVKRSGSIVLVMQSVFSRANPDVVEASEYSEDGINWKPLPKGNKVTGSKYALILDEIKPQSLEIDSTQYQVGIGPSRGKRANKYLTGRTDKACLTLSPSDVSESEEPDTFVDAQEENAGEKKIQVVNSVDFSAELKAPYAVMLR